MAVYEGKRTIDGLLVTADGKKLDEHYEIKRFTRFGFEWTYEGDSPQQLALAILYDHLSDKDQAIRLSDLLMREVVANSTMIGRSPGRRSTRFCVPTREWEHRLCAFAGACC